MEILLLYRSLHAPPPPPPPTPFCYPCLACFISFMESLIRKCYKFFFQVLNIFKECKRRGLMYCVYPDIYLFFFFFFALHSCSLRFPFDIISLLFEEFLLVILLLAEFFHFIYLNIYFASLLRAIFTEYKILGWQFFFLLFLINSFFILLYNTVLVLP